VNYLSLFSGAMGGDLGYQHILKWRCTGYVEIEDYCQRVIKQRQLDGLADKAPIFTDIKAFIDSGCCELYKGITDVITAGFPCQPFSVAGKQAGADDPRNMWPQTIECIRQIRPKYAFLENVPGLLSSGYFGTIIGALHEARYNAKWCSIGAADVGAAHRRKRIWILANDISKRGEGLVESKNIGKTRQGRWFSKEDLQQIADNPFERTDMWPKPLLRGKMDGVAHRMDRLRAIGNGQVSIVAATAYKLLSGEISEGI